MLTTAHDRGFEPDYVMFDSWYCANETLRLLRSFGWSYLVGIKSNPVLDVHSYIGKMQTFRLSKVMIFNEGEGEVLALRGLGSHRCFSQSSSDGKTRYWCTDHTEMKAECSKELNRIAFFIETFHRTLKQFCTIERCLARKANTSEEVHLPCYQSLSQTRNICKDKKHKSRGGGEANYSKNHHEIQRTKSLLLTSSCVSRIQAKIQSHQLVWIWTIPEKQRKPHNLAVTSCNKVVDLSKVQQARKTAEIPCVLLFQRRLSPVLRTQTWQ